MRDRKKWVVLEIASDQIQAEMLRDLLIDSGVPAMTGQGDTSSFLGVSLQPVRVMVFEEDLELALQLLAAVFVLAITVGEGGDALERALQVLEELTPEQ